jgi:predicted regulator of Ras-like GTPase activity (Roadblock/LC7/MglB family)
MSTQLATLPNAPRTIELKDDFSDVQSVNGLVVLACGSAGTLNVPSAKTQAQVTAALIAAQSAKAAAAFLAQNSAPTIGPNDGNELTFLNQDGQVYLLQFGDGNVLTFSGAAGEMATVTVFQGAYSLKSSTNSGTTFVQGAITANPTLPVNPAQPAPTQTAQPV